MSTETLVRGANFLKQQTMSLESGPTYAALIAERDRLLVTRHCLN